MSTTNDKSKEKQQATELYDAIRVLREQGVGTEVDLPEIVVCGAQSSGKSTVLSRVTGFTLPTDEGVCTRFPIRLSLKRNPNLKIEETKFSASIQRHESTPLSKAMSYEQFNADNSSSKDQNPDVVAKWIGEATVLMGLKIADPENPRKSDENARRFSYDVFCLEIEGPFPADITVIDMPGLFEAVDDEESQTESDIDLVKEMSRIYVSKPNTVVLAVMEAGRDMKTHHTLTFLAECEKQVGRQFQVLAVVTKPDLETTKSSRGRLIKQINGNTIKWNSHQMTHGWHVLRNFSPSPEIESAKESRKDVKEREAQFFQTDDWQELRVDLRGLKQFNVKLESVQLILYRGSLTEIIAQINDRIHHLNAEMQRLESSPSGEGSSLTVDDTLIDLALFLHNSRERRSFAQGIVDWRLNITDALGRISREYQAALSASVSTCFFNDQSPSVENLTIDTRTRLETTVRELLSEGLQWQIHPKYVHEVFLQETREWRHIVEKYITQLSQHLSAYVEALLTHHRSYQTIFPAFSTHFLKPALKVLESDLKSQLTYGTSPIDLDGCEKPAEKLLQGVPSALAAFCEKQFREAWLEVEKEQKSVTLDAMRHQLQKTAAIEKATEEMLVDMGIRSFCLYYKAQLNKLRAADAEDSIRVKIEERIRKMFDRNMARDITRNQELRRQFTPTFDAENAAQYRNLVEKKDVLEKAMHTLQKYLPIYPGTNLQGLKKRRLETALDGDDVVMLDVKPKRARQM